MSRKIAQEVLPRLRQRYAGRGREGRSRLIDEVCEQWGYSRKHAIKLLNAKAGWGGRQQGRRAGAIQLTRGDRYVTNRRTADM